MSSAATSKGHLSDRFSDIKFRILILGRANAGKTTILQRVCGSTEQPLVYKWIGFYRSQIGQRTDLIPNQGRGEHDIRDELVFANHGGYTFHDSRGLENGSDAELKTIQDFVHEMGNETRLKDRLHAIWYCIPMDDDRPEQNIQYINTVCPDKNIPVVAVFTKYEAFKDKVKMEMERENESATSEEIEKRTEQEFDEHYLTVTGPLRVPVPS